MQRSSLQELAVLLLKLGTLSFGGPAAHIALMEEEVVKRRRWLSHEYFLDLLGATNLIPGPNSSEMAIHIGFVRAGLPGLIVAGVCFISPAVIISLLLAHFYVRYGSIPQVGHFVWGIRSGVIAVILAALFRLAKPLVKNRFVAAVSIAVFVLNLCHVDEIILLIVAGIVGLLWGIRDRITHRTLPLFLAAILPIAVGTARWNSPNVPASGIAISRSSTQLNATFAQTRWMMERTMSRGNHKATPAATARQAQAW